MARFVELCAHQVTNQKTSIAPGNILFDKIYVHRSVNCEQSYDLAKSTLTILEDGLYWFHFSAGIPAHIKTNCTIYGLYNISIIKDNTTYQDDQVATDGIALIPGNTTMSVVTDCSLYSSSSVGETSWLWFKLDTATETSFAFYVVKENSAVLLSYDDHIHYDSVIIKENNVWDSDLGKFIAPESGYYFISYSSAASPGTNICFDLIKNNDFGSPLAASCANETSSYHNGVAIGRVAVMVYLKFEDDICTAIKPKSTYNVDNGYIYLQGFFYKPTGGAIAVAWSVVRNVPKFCGLPDPIEFDTVYVNESNPWNSLLNKVVIPYGGLYLVVLSTHVCDGNENMQVMLNNNPIIVIKWNTTGFNGCISRSRPIMIHLKTEDILRVRVPNNESHYLCNNRYFHAFTGFRLYSND